MIFLATYNYDWEESMFSSTDLEAVMEDVKESFDTESAPRDKDFRKEVNEIYEGGKWKGFVVYALHPATGEHVDFGLERASAALSSNHAMIAFTKWLEVELEKKRKKSELQRKRRA